MHADSAEETRFGGQSASSADGASEVDDHRTLRRRTTLGAARPWAITVAINVAIGAVLLVTATGVSLAFGWHGVASRQRERLSTELLVRLVPHEPEAGGPLMNELLQRIARNRLDDDELALALALCVDGDGVVEVGDENWRQRYERLSRLWRRQNGRPAKERERLFAIPAQLTVSAPPVWPTDAPTPLHLRMREWWPVETVCRLRIELPGVDEPITAIRAPGTVGLRPIVLDVPPPATGVDEITLRLHIDRWHGPDSTAAESTAGGGTEGSDDAEHRWRPIQMVDIAVAVGTRASLADTLHPLVDERLDDGMRAVFETGLLRWRDGDGRVAIQFTPQAMVERIPEDFAIGLDVEIREDDMVRRRSRLWWLVADDRVSVAEWDPPEEDLDAIDRLLTYEPDDQRLERWRIVVSARPDLAFRAYGSSEATAVLMTLPTRYWDGRIELPLRIVDRDDTPPERSWRRVRSTPADAGRLHDGRGAPSP